MRIEFDFDKTRVRYVVAAMLVMMGVGCDREKAPAPTPVHPGGVTASPVAAGPAAGAGGTGAEPHEFVPSEEPAVRLQKEIETAAKVDAAAAARVAGISPHLKCIEKTPDGRWRAHFGYARTGATGAADASVPIGFYNRAWPPPIAQGQPTTFDGSKKDDVWQPTFEANASVAWVLGPHFEIASATSPVCAGSAGALAAKAGGARAAKRSAKH